MKTHQHMLYLVVAFSGQSKTGSVCGLESCIQIFIKLYVLTSTKCTILFISIFYSYFTAVRRKGVQYTLGCTIILTVAGQDIEITFLFWQTGIWEQLLIWKGNYLFCGGGGGGAMQVKSRREVFVVKAAALTIKHWGKPCHNCSLHITAERA